MNESALPAMPQPAPVLTDGSLWLRPWRPDEAGTLVELLHASMDSVGRWLSWCTPAYGLADALHWMRSVEESWAEQDGDCALAIAIDGGATPIGCIGANQFQPEYRMANIGYWLGHAHQGQGFTARALKLFAPHVFERFDLLRLEIVAAERNAPSRRTAERSGAHFEGIARRRLLVHGESHDAAIYALIRGEI